MDDQSPPPSFQTPSLPQTTSRRARCLPPSRNEQLTNAKTKRGANSNSRVLSAPNPTRIFFDPFNSSSTGHQQAENRLAGSTAWRVSRTQKLAYQLKDESGRGGDGHKADLVGAGSEEWEAFVHGGGWKDENKRRKAIEMNVSKIQGLSKTLDSKYAGTEKGDWEMGRIGVVDGEDGLRDIRHAFGRADGASTSKKRKRSDELLSQKRPTKENESRVNMARAKIDASLGVFSLEGVQDAGEPVQDPSLDSRHGCEISSIPVTDDVASAKDHKPPQIFTGLSIYLNGSTAPLISDLRLKQLFAQHGGSTSLSLARRSVTHVILGESSRSSTESDALHGGAGGGGLASSKIHKEMITIRGKSIKYVTAGWVVDSVKHGKRLPESNYMPEEVWGRIAGLGSGFRNSTSSKEGTSDKQRMSVLSWVNSGKKTQNA